MAEAVRAFTPAQVAALQAGGTVTVTVEGAEVAVQHDDAEIVAEQVAGWLVESDGAVTVALDTEITPELRDEGFAREFVSRVQNLRKDSGLEVTDRIAITFAAGSVLSAALNGMAEYIRSETLAVSLSGGAVAGSARRQEEINGEQCDIGIEKITH